MTRDEIIDLASRYLSKEEIVNFPFNGDLFAILVRELPPDRILKEDEGWTFGGYGNCLGYSIDEDIKPRGKWLWMHFISLHEFPPVKEVIHLQPPHVAKGSFQTPDRAREVRFIRIDISNSAQIYENENIEEQTPPTQSPAQSSSKNNDEDNIIQFKTKKPDGKTE